MPPQKVPVHTSSQLLLSNRPQLYISQFSNVFQFSLKQRDGALFLRQVTSTRLSVTNITNLTYSPRTFSYHISILFLSFKFYLPFISLPKSHNFKPHHTSSRKPYLSCIIHFEIILFMTISFLTLCTMSRSMRRL